MSETVPEGVTRDEFNALTKAVTDLTQAHKELAEARTADEREDAKDEIAEATADLDALAKELGISPKALRGAAEKARRDERKEELRPILQELLAEELGDDEEEPPPDDEKPDDEEPPAPTDENEEEDTAPVREHWSNRPLTDILRGR